MADSFWKLPQKDVVRCDVCCLLAFFICKKKTPFVTLQNLQNPGAMGSLDEFRAARGPEFTSSMAHGSMASY